MERQKGFALCAMHSRSLGFTLVELLVVMAIISLLAGMLLPVLQNARKEAHKMTCSSNHRQIYFFNNAYAEDYEGYNPDNYPPSSGGMGYWTTLLAKHCQLKPSASYLYQILPCPAKQAGELNLWHYGFNYYCALKRFSSLPKPSQRAFARDYQTRAFYGWSTPKYHDPSDPSGAGFSIYRHKDGTNLLFHDGHATWLERTRVIATQSEIFYDLINP